MKQPMESGQAFQALGGPIRDVKLLPAHPPGQVIGRNRELGAMHNTVKTGAPIFISGAPGSGKTALAAVLAAAHIAAKDSGGVLWFNQIEDDFRTLVARVGRAYGENTYDGPVALAKMRALLDKNRPLIVLDGMIDADAAREFVKSCPAGTSVIMTNELTAAGPWMPVNLDPLSESDAQKTFRYYAGLQDDAQADDVASLCQFLDGYPLTLQLAGRLVAVENMTSAELMAQLPANAVRDSQQTIIALSFKRLPSSVQGLLLVLASAFTGEASAELMGELSGVPAAQVIPVMRHLVGRGFAREALLYGQSHFTLYEPVRQYATGWLRGYQRLDGLEQRALRAITAYAERHAEQGNVEQIAAEMPNIVSAAAYATEKRNVDSLTRLTGAVRAMGDVFEPELDQLKRLMMLLAPVPVEPSPEPVAPARPEPDSSPEEPVFGPPAPMIAPPAPEAAAADLVQHTLPHVPETSIDETQAAPPPSAEAPEVLEGTQITLKGEDTQPQRPAQPDFVAFTRPVGVATLDTLDTTQPADAEATLPTPVAERAITEPPTTPEDTEQPTDHSQATFEAQLVEARMASDDARQALLLQTLGKYHLDQGDEPRALESYKEALAAYERVGDKDGMAATLEALAFVAAHTTDPRDDLQYAQRGVEIARALGDPGRLGRLLVALGDALLATGDASGALVALTQGIESLRQTEEWTAIGAALSKLGETYLALDQPREAIMMFEQAMVIFHREGLRGQETRTLDRVAVAYALLKQWEQAETYYDRALFLARERFDRPSEALYLGALANVRRMQGNVEGAVDYFRQALHVAYLVGDTTMQAEYTRELGGLLLDDTRTLAQAMALLHEAGDLSPDDDETARLFRRASKRFERLKAAGLIVPPPYESNRYYAAEAYLN